MQSNVMSDRLEAHFGPSTKSMSVRQVCAWYFDMKILTIISMVPILLSFNIYSDLNHNLTRNFEDS